MSVDARRSRFNAWLDLELIRRLLHPTGRVGKSPRSIATATKASAQVAFSSRRSALLSRIAACRVSRIMSSTASSAVASASFRGSAHLSSRSGDDHARECGAKHAAWGGTRRPRGTRSLYAARAFYVQAGLPVQSLLEA